MRRLTGLFLLGLATLLPGGLLLYGFGHLLLGAERLAGQWLAFWLPEGLYLPGMGLITAVLLVLFTGLLARSWIGPPVDRWVSMRIGNIPLIGRAYLTIRDVTQRFSKEQFTGFTEVVFVRSSDGGGRLGLVADRKQLRNGPQGKALIPVFFPAPFQPGGDLELLPEDRLEHIDMSVDHAVSLVFSGGLARGPGRKSEACGVEAKEA